METGFQCPQNVAEKYSEKFKVPNYTPFSTSFNADDKYSAARLSMLFLALFSGTLSGIKDNIIKRANPSFSTGIKKGHRSDLFLSAY